MNLLYITFGNDVSIHQQAAFSAGSFMGYEGVIDSINIITDEPSFYQHLSPHVNVITVTAQQLENWQGSQRFFWRIKIKALEQVCNLYSGKPIMYLDTDTFLHGDVYQIKQQLVSGHALMHENEGALSVKKSKTEKRMWQQIKDKTFANHAISALDCMWNAGVVASPNTLNGNDVALALNICDAMCEAGVARRLIEQFALSIAFEKSYGLVAAKEYIAHYWSVKHLWNEKIEALFTQAYLMQYSQQQVIQAIQTMDKTTIPYAARIKNTNTKLKKWVDQWFPMQEATYL